MSKLEKAAYLSIIIVCMLAAYVLIGTMHVGRANSNTVSTSQMIGKKLSLPSSDWSSARTNLVIAMSSHCRFCLASTPFYRQLADAANKDDSGKTLTVVSTESHDITQGFLMDHKIHVSRIFESSLAGLGIRGTPTILVVNSEGTIKRVYLGKLTAQEEQEVLAQ